MLVLADEHVEVTPFLDLVKDMAPDLPVDELKATLPDAAESWMVVLCAANYERADINSSLAH